jgi:arylsulfatase A-like enzyme
VPRDAFFALALLAAGACGGDEPPRPNVVWVVWDTARADRMSLYGHETKTTPFLDEWAKDARVFDDCLSASSWTVPSHASMFTGLLPAEHGAQHGHEQLDDELVTVAELLRDAGYQTFSWTANPHLSDAENFLQGFDTRRHPWDDASIDKAIEIYESKVRPQDVPSELGSRFDRSGPTPWVVKAAGSLARPTWTEWLDHRDEERPFFAFFNFMEAHRPLIPPRALRERTMTPDEVERSYVTRYDFAETWAYCFGMREWDPAELELLGKIYDAALLELDGLFEDLMRALEERGLEGETLVILTADHGEHLGDRHLLDHQYSVAHALVRVPLVVRLPGKLAKGRESRPVTSFDLFPTVLELAGVAAPKVGSGAARSLLRPDDERPRMSDYSRVFENPLKSVRKLDPERDVSRFEHGLVSLVLGRWKLVQEIGGSARLYDLSSDPAEAQDVAAEHPEEVARLKKALGHWLATLEPIGGDEARLERSAELKAMLESLGY